jgi:hypothetical protein
MYVAPRRFLTLVLGAALLSADACSDSTGPRRSLTPEEANELARLMGAQFASAFMPSAALANKADASLNAVPEPFAIAIDVTVPCPEGGSTRVSMSASGNVDHATQSVTATADGSNKPNGCGFDVHGKTVRVTGELTSHAEANVVNGRPVGVQMARLGGQFSWEASDGRSGTCAISYTATANYTTRRAVVSGNFCGSTINVDAPLTD